ncbi:MAG: rhomboid family intramembrane serine protease [Bacillota bacterium]
MDQRGYLETAGQRFTEFGGFAPVDGERLPRLVAEWAGLVLERVEPGLTTLVAFVPLHAGSLLPALQEQMAAHLAEVAREGRTEALGLLLLVSEERITREIYDRAQGLIHQSGRVRVVAWIADLSREALFGHEGPPFGIDPDLAMLAQPALDRPLPPPEQRRAGGRSGPFPWLTISLAALIVSIWVAMSLVGGTVRATEDSEMLLKWGAALRPHLLQEGEYWRLFTAGFLHIGVAHLFMNTLSLWWIGQLVERLYGPVRMLLIYLIALVAGSVVSVMFGPPLILSAGASGAIFGLLGAVTWYRLTAPKRQRLAHVPIFLLVLLSLLGGLILADNVDNWNHVGGLAGGFLAAAAVGFVEQTGPRLTRALLHGLATLALLAVSGATLLGMVVLPGPAQRMAEAFTAMDEGRLGEAEQGLEKLADAYPKDVRVQLYLALFYAEQGRRSEARAQIDRVLAVDPQNPAARELLRLLQQTQ